MGPIQNRYDFVYLFNVEDGESEWRSRRGQLAAAQSGDPSESGLRRVPETQGAQLRDAGQGRRGGQPVLRDRASDPRTPSERGPAGRSDESARVLACVEREDPLADSVIKPDAAACKRRRLRAKLWRAHEDFATQPVRVNHTPSGGGVALAARIAFTRFSSPIAAYPDGIVSGKSRSGSVLRRAIGIDQPDLARVLLEHAGGARRDERVQVLCRVQRGDQDRLPDLLGPFPDGDRAPLPVSPRFMP